MMNHNLATWLSTAFDKLASIYSLLTQINQQFLPLAQASVSRTSNMVRCFWGHFELQQERLNFFTSNLRYNVVCKIDFWAIMERLLSDHWAIIEVFLSYFWAAFERLVLQLKNRSKWNLSDYLMTSWADFPKDHLSDSLSDLWAVFSKVSLSDYWAVSPRYSLSDYWGII